MMKLLCCVFFSTNMITQKRYFIYERIPKTILIKKSSISNIRNFWCENLFLFHWIFHVLPILWFFFHFFYFNKSFTIIKLKWIVCDGKQKPRKFNEFLSFQSICKLKFTRHLHSFFFCNVITRLSFDFPGNCVWM
jgi:hypothetical protein